MKTKQLQIVAVALALLLIAVIVWYMVTKKTEWLYNALPSAIADPIIKPIMNQTLEQRISTLHPAMQPYVVELITRAKDELGMELTIPKDGAYRSIDEQNALYAKGRTAPGSIVTKVKGGNSWHNYGLAVDVVEVKPLYGYEKGYPKERWYQLGELGKSLGLVWGGDFNDNGNYDDDSWDDLPHFQLPVTQSRSQLLAAVQSTQNPYPPVNIA